MDALGEAQIIAPVVSTNPLSPHFTDVAGLRCSGIFPRGREPSIRSLRHWAKQRRIPYHKVGRFVYFDPAEVEAHSRFGGWARIQPRRSPKQQLASDKQH